MISPSRSPASDLPITGPERWLTRTATVFRAGCITQYRRGANGAFNYRQFSLSAAIAHRPLHTHRGGYCDLQRSPGNLFPQAKSAFSSPNQPARFAVFAAYIDV